MLRCVSLSSLFVRPAIALVPRNVAQITTGTLLADKDAILIDAELAVLTREDLKRRQQYLENKIHVNEKECLVPINGIPEEHVKNRRVRIYKPAKNSMQSGTNNIQHWELEFETRQRWENPLMGWTSTGDPLSNLKLNFVSPDDAIKLCEKNGWAWYIDQGKTEKVERPKSYGVNFSWNKRTRVSTK